MFSHSLVTCLKNIIFFSTSPAPGSFVCPVRARLVLCGRYFIPCTFYPATDPPLSHTSFPAPRPLPYCSGPGRNPHSPVSQPPPPLYSYQPGALRTGRKKEKKKELHLSVRDYRLPLTTDHVRLPSVGSCSLKAKKWEGLQGVESYNLERMAVLRCVCLFREMF